MDKIVLTKDCKFAEGRYRIYTIFKSKRGFKVFIDNHSMVSEFRNGQHVKVDRYDFAWEEYTINSVGRFELQDNYHECGVFP